MFKGIKIIDFILGIVGGLGFLACFMLVMSVDWKIGVGFYSSLISIYSAYWFMRGKYLKDKI